MQPKEAVTGKSDDEIVAKVRHFFATGEGEQPSTEEIDRARRVVYKGPPPAAEKPKLKWSGGEGLNACALVPGLTDLRLAVMKRAGKDEWLWEAKVISADGETDVNDRGWAKTSVAGQIAAEKALLQLLRDEEAYAANRVAMVVKLLGGEA
jgi:hypothetical protein